MRSWPSKLTPRHTLFAHLLLIASILGVYYPAMLSSVHPVDDPGIIAWYSSSPRLSQILVPGNGYYYRPVLEFSFWLDNFCWGMEPVVMHLENILLHCSNALLVFLLARRVSGTDEGSRCWIPILAAFLFALHPVNVEAVGWIAGRSDPLLALFVLSACWFWLRWLAESRWRDLFASLLLFVAALLTKETALAAGAVALLLALTCPGRTPLRQRVWALGAMAAPALLLVVFALFFRSGTSGLSRFISVSDLQWGHAVGDALAATGFYLKKLVLPVPLNFAITEVDSRYALLGAALLPALCVMFLRRVEAAAWFASAALALLPAVLVAVKQIAWTPYAERYLYLPTAFCVLAIASLIGALGKAPRAVVLAVAVPLLAVFAVVCVQRTLLWGDKLAFFQDAIAKSPAFGSLYNDLGGQLLQHDQVEQAATAFATADRLNQRESMRLLIKANLMGVAFAREDYAGVRNQFFQLFKEKKDAGADFLELLQKADSRRLSTLSGEEKVSLTGDVLETLDLLNQKRYDPFWLYRGGQLSLAIGDKAKAADFFSRASRLAPADAHYRKATNLYLRKLGKVQ